MRQNAHRIILANLMQQSVLRFLSIMGGKTLNPNPTSKGKFDESYKIVDES